MVFATTKSEPLMRPFIEIKATQGKHFSEAPGVALWNKKKGEDHGKLKIEGAIGTMAQGIISTLMNDLVENEGPVIEKITIHPEGIWIIPATGIGMPMEKIIGWAEGVIAHAVRTGK